MTTGRLGAGTGPYRFGNGPALIELQWIRYAYEERLLVEKIMSNQALKSIRLECIGLCDGRKSKRIFHSDDSFDSFPLDLSREQSRTRAVLRNGAVEHLQPPIYHGNPLSEKGSLVFTDCGRDVIDRCREAGFPDAFMLYYYSPAHALIGGGLQFLFVGVK